MVFSLFRIDPSHSRDLILTLATAAETGIPLPRTLESLSHGGNHDAFYRHLGRMIRDLDEGQPLSAALHEHLRPWLPRHWIAAIAQAEAEDQLAPVLAILSAQRASDTDDSVKAVMVQLFGYLIVMLTILAGLMIFIVPKFAKIFDEMASGMPLPATTVLLQKVCSACEIFWPALGLLPFLSYRLLRSRPSQLMSIPILGRGSRMAAAEEAAQSIAAGLETGVDILDAVQMASYTCPHPIVRTRLQECLPALRSGEPWFDALRQCRLFDHGDLWMLSANLRTPQRGFEAVADWSADQLRSFRQRRRRLIEATGLACCALFTLTACTAIFSALSNLTEFLVVHWP